jgi:hypothetical protein
MKIQASLSSTNLRRLAQDSLTTENFKLVAEQVARPVQPITKASSENNSKPKSNKPSE